MSAPDVAFRALSEALRQLGGHHDAYLPVQGEMFDGDFEIPLLVVTTMLVISLGSLAAGAGIGGGGLFVPLYAFVLGVGAKAAVPMSKATILGGAIGNMISIAFARHPDPEKNRPLIDYEASTFMQSGELLGVIFGVLLNMLLPEVAIIVFLAVLLSFNGYKTMTKGIQKYKAESSKLLKSKEQADQVAVKDASPSKERKRKEKVSVSDLSKLDFEGVPCNEGSGLSAIDLADIILGDLDEAEKGTDISSGETRSGSGSGDPSSGNSNEEAELTTMKANSKAEAAKELQALIIEDSAQFPIWPWVLLGSMTIYTLLYALVKSSLLSVCSPGVYWAWYFTPVVVLLGFMYVTAMILKKKHARRVAAGYKFKGEDEDEPAYRDMKWTDQSLKQYPAVALLAGVSAGLLGIGGGMVIGPLFIQLDMEPKVGSSSCAFMILWTALSGVVQYWFAGKIGLQFIFYGVAIGFVSGQMGQRIVDAALKKSGRPSYVIFLLGSIVLVACAAMTISGAFKVGSAVSAGETLFAFDLYDFQCHAAEHH